MSLLTEFSQRLDSYVSRPCIGGEGFSYNYSDLTLETAKWHSRYEALKIPRHSVVGLRADYSMFAIAAMLALCARGSVAALLPADRAVDEYIHSAHAGSFVTIHTDGSYEYKHSADSPRPHPLLARLWSSEEGGLVIFTSGSCGQPKATLHSLERFLGKFQRRGRSLRTLAFLLFDHVAGLDTLFYTFSNGGSVVLPTRRDPLAILDLIASQRVQVLPTSPSFLRMLSALNDDRSRDLSSLEVITYGSEPMDSATLQHTRKRFPRAQIQQKYGTTETGSPRTLSRGDNSLWLKIKSDSADVKVLDDVLWLRSKSSMLGYLNAPSPLDENGWYCTGDVVETDGEWMRFLGRTDDIIKVGGEKVVPAEVECVIRELSFVRDVLVLGEPHPLLGQIVTTRVALDPHILNVSAAATSIRSHCRQRLAPHQVPVRIGFASEQSIRPLSPRLKARPHKPSAPGMIASEPDRIAHPIPPYLNPGE